MFERFTDRARLVVVLAQEESRRLDHNYIGTEHILLGLVQEGEGVAAQALVSLGIKLEDVRHQVKEIIGAGNGPVPPGTHIPFTPRAKRVLELSLREALHLGHNYLGTEHILLGLIREGEGVAAEVLAKLGADLAKVRSQVIVLLSGTSVIDVPQVAAGPTASGPLSGGLFGSFGTTSLTASALSEVLAQAQGRGHPRLGTEHILLWLLGLPTAGATRALEGIGVDLKALRERLETQLSESGDSTDP